MTDHVPSPRRNIRRVVILGHTGFIGSHLLEGFRTRDSALEVTGFSEPANDLSDPSCVGALAEAFDRETLVILCAAVKRQFGDTLEAFNKNMAIVENVVTAVSKSPVSRLAFMSSAAVYGEETHNTCISESTPVNPTSYYGIAKFTGECVLRKSFAGLGEASLVCFRPPLVYGPGDRGKTYGPAGFSASARAGEPITLWGDGRELREFLFIHDLIDMICTISLGEFDGAVNLVSGSSHTFLDVLECLREITPAPLRINSRERSKTKVDNAFDGALVRSLLPKSFVFTPLKEGVRKTFEIS